MKFGAIDGICRLHCHLFFLSRRLADTLYSLLQMAFLFTPEIWATVLTVIFGALFALVGIVYRSLKQSIDGNDTEAEELDERLSEIELRVRTLFSWAFGTESDSTDEGFAGDIQSKLSRLNEQLEQFNKDADERHEELVQRLDELILQLDDEDALEFERDDLE